MPPVAPGPDSFTSSGIIAAQYNMSPHLKQSGFSKRKGKEWRWGDGMKVKQHHTGPLSQDGFWWVFMSSTTSEKTEKTTFFGGGLGDSQLLVEHQNQEEEP